MRADQRSILRAQESELVGGGQDREHPSVLQQRDHLGVAVGRLNDRVVVLHIRSVAYSIGEGVDSQGAGQRRLARVDCGEE